MTSPVPPAHLPKDILTRFYDAERTYTLNPTHPTALSDLLKTLSPSIKLVQTPALPYGGTWTGHTGFQAWITQMADHFDTVDVQDPVVFSNETSNKLIINSHLRLRVRKTQKELHYPMCQVVVVDTEEGVIKEIMPFYWDVRGLLEALESE